MNTARSVSHCRHQMQCADIILYTMNNAIDGDHVSLRNTNRKMKRIVND